MPGILALARAQVSGKLSLDSGNHHNPEATIERLAELAIFGHLIIFNFMTENGEQCIPAWRTFRNGKEMKMNKQNRKIMNYSIIKTLVGDLMLVADASALTGLYFEGCQHVPAASKRWTLDAQHPVLENTAKQLSEYFEGKRTSFSRPLRLASTDFQEKIWQQIALIPYGDMISYSELAKRAGVPQAIRAAGTATGQNPLSIIIPCHRVMGKDGTMCGFAGGLERKRLLLELEKRGNSRDREHNQKHHRADS